MFSSRVADDDCNGTASGSGAYRSSDDESLNSEDEYGREELDYSSGSYSEDDLSDSYVSSDSEAELAAAPAPDARARPKAPSPASVSQASAALPKLADGPVYQRSAMSAASQNRRNSVDDLASYGSASLKTSMPTARAPAPAPMARAAAAVASAPRAQSRALALTEAPTTTVARAARPPVSTPRKKDPLVAASSRYKARNFDKELENLVKNTHYSNVTVPLDVSGGLSALIAKGEDYVRMSFDEKMARNIFRPTMYKDDDPLRRRDLSCDYSLAKVMSIEVIEWGNPSDVNLSLRFAEHDFLNPIHTWSSNTDKNILLNLPSNGAGETKTGVRYDCLKEVAASQLYSKWGRASIQRFMKDLDWPSQSVLTTHPEYHEHGFVRLNSILYQLLSYPAHAIDFGLVGYHPKEHGESAVFPTTAICEAISLAEKHLFKQLQNISLNGLTLEWGAANGEPLDNYRGRRAELDTPISAYVTLRIGVTFPGSEGDFVSHSGASAEEKFATALHAAREKHGLVTSASNANNA